jgi:hypothetical protein
MAIGEAVTIGLLLGASAIAVVYAKMKFQPGIELAQKLDAIEVLH